MCAVTSSQTMVLRRLNHRKRYAIPKFHAEVSDGQPRMRNNVDGRTRKGQ